MTGSRHDRSGRPFTGCGAWAVQAEKFQRLLSENRPVRPGGRAGHRRQDASGAALRSGAPHTGRTRADREGEREQRAVQAEKFQRLLSGPLLQSPFKADLIPRHCGGLPSVLSDGSPRETSASRISPALYAPRACRLFSSCLAQGAADIELQCPSRVPSAFVLWIVPCGCWGGA